MTSTLAYLAEAERRGATGHAGPNAGGCACDLCWVDSLGDCPGCADAVGIAELSVTTEDGRVWHDGCWRDALTEAAEKAVRP
ncbi:hypothetical protein [Nocardia nova]|uniref:hypothetical protein n=1 Tax=Nocardia nova TaxID=37330 RepID=UPI0027389A43|nr:hypothetical protein [Nocardia nova]